MMTVNEVSKLSGVSVRTLHYYDEIGLLKPAGTNSAGYRFYNEEALKKLQSIMLFKELEFSLKDIRKILESPDFDTEKALAQQIELLTLRRDHLNELISFAEKLRSEGGYNMEFKNFNEEKLKEYEKKAKESWGGTKAWTEYEKKTASYSKEKFGSLGKEMMDIFKEFGKIKNSAPSGEEAQALVKKLQSFITDNYYNCTDQILAGLGQMYSAEGEMKNSIDSYAGAGSADFAAKAIAFFCSLR